jgi:phage terminase large subunit-like protein
MRNFLTKRMNVWVAMPEAAFINLDKWGDCKGAFPDMRGKSCFVGVDLSSKNDLTSVAFEFKQDGKYYVYSHSFIPSDMIDKKEREEKMPYRMWIGDGWITVINGACINYQNVKSYIIDECNKNGWKISCVCPDPWGAAPMIAEFEALGVKVEPIIQGIKTLSEPTKDIRYCVLDRRIVHNGNPVLSWAVSNAVIDIVDRNENIILSKKRSKNKIDPVAALVNAHVMAMGIQSETYQTRDMRSLDG